MELFNTRKIERHEELNNFGQFYEILVQRLEEIQMSQSGWNTDTVTDACTLMSTVTNIQFVHDDFCCCLEWAKPCQRI